MSRDRNGYSWGLSAVVVLGVLSRVAGLWEWPLMGDEYLTLIYAGDRYDSFVNPAYYLLTYLQTRILEMPEWTIRLPSVVFALASIPVVYLTAAELFDRRTGLFASVLLVLHSWHLMHSQYARYYAAVVLFSLLAYYLFFRAYRTDSLAMLAGAVVSALISMFFHLTSVLVLFALGLFAVAAVLSDGKLRLEGSKRIARTYVIASGVGVVLLIPLLLMVVETWTTGSRAWTGDSVGFALDFVNQAGLVLCTAAAAAMLALFANDLTRATYLGLAGFVPLIALAGMAELLPAVRAKYGIAAFPILIVLGAHFASSVAGTGRHSPIASYGALAVLCASLLPGTISYFTGRVSLDSSDPVEAVSRRASNGDLLVVFSQSMRYNHESLAPGLEWHVVERKGVWRKGVTEVADREATKWVVVDTYRSPLIRPDLESWLMDHGRLVWRKTEIRFDYAMRGYEVWRVGRVDPEALARSR